MQSIRNAVLLVLLATTILSSTAGATTSTINWPNKSVSWWYAVESNWPLMVEQVSQHVDVVTSIMLYCGPTALDNGTISLEVSPDCFDPATGNGTIPALWAAGIRPELVLNGGNGSIEAYRAIWADPEASVPAMVALAVATNVSGWNMDFEASSGENSDAVPYAAWLAVLRTALHAVNVRLTICTATWGPVINQLTVLAPSVDRLMYMETYNADSMAQWMGYYANIVNANVPRQLASVGLGCWVDSTTNNTWTVTPESAVERVNQAISDDVPELCMFRLMPVTGGNPSSWPEDFWWSALVVFVQ